ncbi:GEVED domain-containing protein [Candidatus Pollutiaquabacter sp.]|uniref:GEVED domain-containing protein n=1 Tax=Candidatus Pollutiaquabacter sp. TaxID=3416354 RepID=UPI003CB975F8|nr:lamin tail domain-containing protein [Bacteroidota bacterium]
MENKVYFVPGFYRWLRALCLTGLFITGLSLTSTAQVTTNSGSGLAPSYSDLATAITALNGATISSPVVITLTANETAPAGGYSITAQGSSANTITIDGGGFTITANGTLTAGALNDALIKLVGADFVTIQNFVMQENPANTTTTAASNNMTEWGVALLYASTTNGASSNTIQNNTISLSRLYQNSFGIYANATHSASAPSTSATATGAAGAHDSLRVYTNNISNVNNGIVVVGPTAAADQADYVDIGGSSAGTGNTISNYGNTGTFSSYANVSGTVYGILVRNTRNINVQYNSITSSNTTGALTSSGTLRGIYVPSFSVAPTGTNSQVISNNTISVTTGVATGTLHGISVETTTGNATTSLTINTNTFQNCGHNVASPSGTTIFIISAMANLNTTINNNVFSNLSTPSTGSVTFISNSITIPANGTQTIQANAINTAFNKTGAGGTVTFFTSGASTVAATVTILHRNNNFSNVTVTGATTITGWNNTDGLSTSLNNKTYQNNTFSNITGGTSAITIMNLNYGGTGGGNGNVVQGNVISNITGQGAITGITHSSSTTGGVVSFFGNTITGLSSTGTGGSVTALASSSATSHVYSNVIGDLSSTGSASTVTGISISSATASNIYKNKVYGLTSNGASGIANGITVSAGTTSNIYNNIVGNLSAPTASLANAINGINITGGTTVNAYYNTVYFSASSSGANFGTTALFANTTPTVTLRNNLLHNASSANGTGLAVAYRRSGTTLTSYGSASNNNDFVAATIYYDGTASYSWSGYQALVATRDAASVNWTPVYLSLVGNSANFLHIDPAVATLLESGAVNITTPAITDDYDANIRQGNGGYGGSGTAPDIGADEFEGTPPALCAGVPSAGTATHSPAFACGSGSTNLSVNDPNLSLGVTIQWYVSTTSGGPYTPVAGGNSANASSGAVTATSYFVASFKCSYTGDSILSNEVTYTVYPAASVSVSPTSGNYCAGSTPVALAASGGSTYAWSPATGLNATTGATVNASPTANTTYTVTGTDANGCTATATAAVTYSLNLTSLTATATPSSICSGGTSVLNATATTPALGTYTQSTGTYALEACGSNAGPTGDDAVMAATAIGFTFNYFGVNYTQFTISTNGNIQLGDGSGTTNNPAYSTAYTDVAMPNTGVPNNMIAFAWDDWLVGAGEITYGLTGTAPFRKLVVCFNSSGRGGGVADNFNGQVVIEETTNIVRIVTTNKSVSTNTATQGIENQGGTVAYPVTGRNSVAWSATNDMQVFTPNVIAVSSYAWSPSTFLNNPAIQSPTASAVSATTTYTVVATASNGCTLSATTTLTAGDPLGVSAAAAPATICSGQSTSLSAIVTGGGAPFTYDWSDGTGTIGTTNPLSVLPASTTTFTVTVSDNCGATASATVTVTVNPSPSVSVSPTSSTYCGTAIPLTASGTADTYAWSPAAGLNATTGTSVNASPSASTTYTVTGTTTANGCTTTATATVLKGVIIQSVTPSATPSTVCNNGTSNLNVTAVAAQPFVRITEVTFYDQGTGLTSPYPAWVPSTGVQDYIEITNTSIVSADISGWTFGDYSSGSATANHPYTFLPGTVIPPNSVLVLHMGTGTDDVTNRLYNTGGTGNFYSSGTSGGFILKNGSTFVDVVSTNTNTFNVALGVTATEWSGSGASAPSGNAGCVRTAANDSNTGADWTASSTTAQTIGTFNAGYNNPNNGTITGFAWSPSTYLDNSAIQTPTASLMTATTTYTVTVTEALGCTATGTVTVTVGAPLVVSASATPGTICTGSSSSLSASASGGGAPYTYDWSDGVGSIGTTNPLSISPSASGTYTVTVTDNCGATMTATASVTVNTSPTVSVTNSNPNLCAPIVSSTLTASGADTYAWSPSVGLNATTGTTVTATPSATTVYTVVGTAANGCTASATTTVVKGVDFLTTTATATPATVCVGGSSQLNAGGTLPTCSTYYSIASATYGLQPTTGFTALGGGDDIDLATSVALPFSFNFFGTTQTTINFGSNGYVYFGAANGGSILAAGVTNGINFSAADMLPAAGQVSYGTVGVSPNQIFVIDYNAMPEYSGGGTHTGQIQIFQNGKVEIHIASATSSTRSKTMGLRNAAGTDNAIPTGFNNTTWTVSTPVAYAFTQCFTATITGYNWSPSGNLDNPSLANPVADPMLVNTTYTVTITNSTGCTATATVAVTVDPLVVSATGSPNPACAGSSSDLTAIVTGGGSPYTYDWSDGTGSIGTTNPLTIVPASTTTYTVTVSDFCGATQSATVTVNVAAPPSVSVTNSAPGLCAPITSSTLTASGADTYVWSPSAGLNATTGASVTATPLVATTYTVVGTSTATGCTASATTTVTPGVNFTSVTASAAPSNVCAPGTTQLSVSATLPSCPSYYTSGTTTYGLQSTAGFASGPSGDDGELLVTMPFSINFFGAGATNQVDIVTNGYVVLGGGISTAYTPQTIPSATAPNNVIAAFWCDLNAAAGQITYGTVGIAPNRTFVIDYNAVPELSGGGTHSGQIHIKESGRIEVHITSVSSTRTKTLGAENAGGTSAVSDPLLNNTAWTTATPFAVYIDLCTTATISSYSWSPAADLNDPNIVNPVATNILGTSTYTVTVTNSAGCTGTASVTVTVAPLAATAAASPASVCSGNPASLTATVTGGGEPYTYDWSDGTGSIGATNPLTVNPATSSVYTVTITDACLNTTTATVSVSVLPSPTVSLSGPAGICTSGPATLTASGTAISYAWPGNLDPTVYTTTVYFSPSAQPIETNVGPGNVVASTTLPALPAGAVVNSYTLTYNGITALTNSFGSDVNLGFQGAVTAAATSGIGSPAAAGTFNFVQTYTGGVNTAGGTVDLLYWDVADDNTGTAESTFPTGTNVASLVISYQIPASGTSLVVTPTTTTTYTVIGTGASGCTATATWTVVIPPASTTTATATPSNVCAGGSSQLNASATYPPPTAPTYCAVTNQGSSCVTSVSINTLNSTPPACVSPFYNFNAPTGSNTTTLMPGSTYTFNVTTGGTAIVSVFIDFDRNGVYDASEWFQPYTAASSGSISIPVPSGASIGQTGMRVRSRLNGNTNDATTACLVGMGSGSTEDYVVTIGTPISGSFTYSWTPSANLDNAAIANPLASPIAATTTYTVTASDIYGCTSTATVTVNVNPLSVSADGAPTTICEGAAVSLTSTVTGGGEPYSYSWSDGTSVVGTTAALSVSPTTTTSYTLTVTDNCATVVSATPVTITVNPAPGVSVTPSSALYCPPTAVALTASSGTGGTTFVWSPATGLNATTGATVNASPTTSTTYTVTGTGTNGCTSTATVAITTGTAITVDATADTTQSCAPMGTILRACVNPVLNTYNVTSATYGLQSTAGFSNGPTGDDTFGGPYAIPFSFNYFGNLYNDLYIGTNGYITFGSGSGDRFVQTFPSATAPNNIVAIGYCDLNVTTAGMVTYGTVGVAPNRIFVIDFNGVPPFSGTGTLSGQIQLFENGNKVEIHVTSASLTNAKTLGIENSTGTSGASPTGRNNAAWTVTTPEAWSFVAAARQCNNTGITFSWSPATALTATNLDTAEVSGLNTTTQYTVTAMNASGCAATDTVTLIIFPQAPTPTITPSGPLSFCPGGSVTLTSSNTSFPNSWSTGETTVSITVSTTQTVTLIASDAYCPSDPTSVNVLRHDTIQPLINVSGGGLAICGGTRDLLADGAPQFTAWNWSTTETTQQITIGTPGTYGVSATDLNGCLTYNSVTFVAGQTPVAPVISTASNDTVCNNDLVTITSDLSDGLTWFPTFDNTASISYNLSPPGSYEFYVTRDSLGCTSESNHLTFVVNPSPEVTAFSPADSACVGDVITLSGSGFTNVSSISFNGTPATTFTVVDDFTITVTVPAGATSGGITLTDGSTGCAGVSPLFTIKVVCGSTLNMTAFIQGYYSGGSMAAPLFINGISPNATDCDTIKVCLMHPTTYAEVECATGILQTDGTVSLSFTSSGYFFIKVTHQNAVQTWSADSVNVTGTTSYDFTTDNLQSYGPNMVEVATGVWAFWSGDVNQDELVEATDYTTVENDAVGFVSGYFPSDLTGDAITEAADYSLIENNLPFFLASVHP